MVSFSLINSINSGIHTCISSFSKFTLQVCYSLVFFSLCLCAFRWWSLWWTRSWYWWWSLWWCCILVCYSWEIRILGKIKFETFIHTSKFTQGIVDVRTSVEVSPSFKLWWTFNQRSNIGESLMRLRPWSPIFQPQYALIHTISLNSYILFNSDILIHSYAYIWTYFIYFIPSRWQQQQQIHQNTKPLGRAEKRRRRWQQQQIHQNTSTSPPRSLVAMQQKHHDGGQNNEEEMRKGDDREVDREMIEEEKGRRKERDERQKWKPLRVKNEWKEAEERVNSKLRKRKWKWSVGWGVEGLVTFIRIFLVKDSYWCQIV